MAILSEIDRAVLRTLAYFDLFDFPLTATEIHENLVIKNQTTYLATINSLNNLKSSVDNAEGFYFLKNKEKNVLIRKERYRLAEEKYKIALKNIKLLKKLPFIEAIFIVNKLAYCNATDSGDIDLAIITKPNRIWSARLFSAGLMKILNRRPRPNQTKNKICLSFFITSDNLNLESVAMEADIHFAYWIKQFFPIYDPKQLYQKFWENNKWLNEYFANREPQITSKRRTVKKSFSFLKLLIEFTWISYFEKLTKKWQMSIMPQTLKQINNQSNTNVLLDDKILKLHLSDIRADIQSKWDERCQTLIPGVSVSDLIDLLKKSK